MVFVRQVVAVPNVWADKIPEIPPDDHGLARIQCDDILLGYIIRVSLVGGGNCFPITHQTLMFFHVKMHRVNPASTAVTNLPDIVAPQFLLS